MGTLIPPPLYREESKSEGHGPTIGGILFGVVFTVLAALIFTTTLKPKGFVKAAPAEAVHPPMPTLPLNYPPTRTVDASEVRFGVKIDDPYRWLEDGKSPEVQKWLAAQNKLARSYLDSLPGRE